MSLIFILPLVVLYQIGIVQAGSNVRNLAEVWMTGPLALLGLQATTAINILVLSGVVAALMVIQRAGTLSIVYAVFMTLESLIYALLLLSGVGIAAAILDESLQNILSSGWLMQNAGGLPQRQLLLGIGAGVYEELLFRVMFIGGGTFLMVKIFSFSKLFSILCMLIISSILFSAVHHIGTAGEPIHSYVFIFRTLCGTVLGLIYIFRGPGIPVMTHSLYNVIVIIAMTHTSGA